MKISPVAQPTGIPGVQTNQRTSPDRIAVAKAIAAGEQPVKVLQSDMPVDPQLAKMQANIRSLRIKTNVSPDRNLTEPVIEEPVDDTQNAISSNSEPTTQPEDTKPLSPQFAALAKQKRALQQERAAFEQEKAKLGGAAKDGSTVNLDRLQSDPLSVLDEAGVLDDKFYNALTARLMNGQDPSAAQIRALEAKIESLTTGIDTKFTERDTQAEEQIKQEIKREAEQMVSSGDEFKYTRALGEAHEAARLIYTNYERTGEVWDTRQALALIEADCKARQDKIQQALTPAQEAVAQQIQQRPQGMRTLTNRDSARPQQSRRDRMIAAFKGELKK